jgi:two-component system CheB/CheR fusion protein
MPAPRCDPAVVGAIAVLQSAFPALPLPRGVASLVEAGLERVSGVSSARLTLFAEPVDANEPPPAGTERIWLDTLSCRFGWLDVTCEDLDAFRPYEPYVRNLANAIALHAQGIHQQERLKRMLADREHLLDALRDADRRKNEFLGMLSHELRNPLAPLRNSLYILSKAATGGEQAQRALAIIDRQVGIVNRLVEDLLDITRIERGKVRLDRERVSLGDLVARVVEDHRDLFARSDVRLELVGSGEDIPVDADPTRIAQVMGNLLQNAVKFTSPGGSVAVHVERADGCATVSVRDTGEGIAPDMLAHLFDPFVQADSTLHRNAGGLGLGLALVKALVELHGGSVRARSDGIGKGAEFVVTLPLAAPAIAAPAHPEDASGARRRRLVLVIEDGVDAGQSLAEILELEGHAVHVARDGRTGVALARELRPDVVLCDLGLPDIDGYEVARTLRRDDALRGIRLVALSGYTQPEDRQRATEAGFDAHVAKPTGLDDLMIAMAGDRS